MTLTHRQADKIISEQIFKRIPCDGWKSGSFGSAGGPYMMKYCTHPNDTCYPSTAPWDKDCGAPMFCTNALASKQLRAKLAELGYWWEMWFTSCGHFRFELISKGCAIKSYEGEADTEEAAVALCALSSLGMTDVELVP